MARASAQPTSDRPPATQPAPEADAASPPPPAGPPAGTGVLRQAGEAPREVPLMSIRQDAPAGERVQVGPVTRGLGVPDVLLGSIGLVAVAVIASVILGAILGGLLVLVKHRLGWGGPDKDAENHISLTDGRR